jgi:hypothetical protein
MATLRLRAARRCALSGGDGLLRIRLVTWTSTRRVRPLVADCRATGVPSDTLTLRLYALRADAPPLASVPVPRFVT